MNRRDLIRLYGKLAGVVRKLGRESEAAAIAYLDEKGYDEFIVLRGTLAEAEAVRADYGVEGIPHTFVIDRQGIIRHADHPIRLRDRHIEPWL